MSNVVTSKHIRIMGITMAFLLTVFFPLRADSANHKYDQLNRLARIDYASGGSIKYQYDAGGNIVSIQNSFQTQMAWEKMEKPPVEFLIEIWGTAENNIYAVGNTDSQQEMVLLHYNGVEWSKEPIPKMAGGFLGIWGSDENNVFAVGSGAIGVGGVVLHYDGVSWKRTIIEDVYLYDVWVDKTGNAYAVGTKGHQTGQVLQFNGTSWTTVYDDPKNHYRGVWGDDSGNIYAVGTNGVILHYNGTSWAEMASSTSEALQEVWGASPSDIYIVGNNDAILHYDGSGWEKMPPPASGVMFFSAVWGTSSDNVYVSNPNSDRLLHHDGQSWTEITSTDVSLRGIRDIWGTSPNNLFAVTSRGEILHYGNPDADGDGLPDAWEVTYFGDTAAYAASDDPDNDGIGNIDEYLNGTDPTKANGAGGNPFGDALWSNSDFPLTKEPKQVPQGYSGTWHQYIKYPQGAYNSSGVYVDDQDNVHLIGVALDDLNATDGSGNPYHISEAKIYYKKMENGQWGEQEAAVSDIRTYPSNTNFVENTIREVALAVDSSGNVHCVYGQKRADDNNRSDIFYVERAASGWSQPVNISNTTGEDSRYPKVLTDKQGKVYVIWRDSVNSQKQIQYRIRENGAWGTTRTIPSFAASNFHATTDERGYVHVVGFGKDASGNYQMAYIRMDNGLPSAPEIIHGDYLSNVRVFAANGRVYVSGDKYDWTSGLHKLHLFKREAGAWSQDTQQWPEAAAHNGFGIWEDKGENLHVIYMGKDQGMEKVLERAFDGSTWSDYRVISDNEADSPYVAHGNENILAAAWEDDNERNIRFSHADYSTATISKPVLFVSPASRPVDPGAGSFSLNIANTGTGAMTWNADVIDNESWLSIESGNMGVNSGTVTVTYEANTGAERVAEILITAEGAENNPYRVAVKQAAGDSDMDGLPDDWERQFFGDINATDGTTDADNDGVIDKDEFLNNTDPTQSSDEDSDGMPDDWEVANGLDPNDGQDAFADTDQDGVANYLEHINGSDPLSNDYFTVSGTVQYLGGQTGQLDIAAYRTTDTAFESPVGGQRHDWSDGMDHVDFKLKIPNGAYRLRAFIDMDADGQVGPNEPLGIYDEETIMIDHSDDATPRNFTLKADPDSTDGLVAWYPFDEGFDDRSGENRHPEPVGAPEREAGPCGDGNVLRVSEGNYLRVPAERRFIPGDGSFTISVDFFIESESDIANSRLLTLQRGDFSDGAALWARIREKGYPHVRLMMDDLEGERPFQNLYSGPIEIQKWMNVAAVVDRERNTTSLYLDGVKVDEAELQMGSIDPTKDMLIGAYDYGDRIVSGNILMDDLRIYDRPLSDEEIATLSEICPPVASESMVSIEPSRDTVKPGRSFRTKILVEGGDLWAAQIRLKADPGKLELIDQGNYGHLMPKFRRFEIDIDADPFSGTWSGALSLKHPAEPVTGEGVFARGIKFQALENVYGEVDISGEAVLTDRFGDALPATVVGGTITIDDGIHGGDNVIQGTVTYPDGTPAVGVDVTISIGGNEYTVQTDANGHYVFEDINDLADEQAYQIEVTNGDFYGEATVDSLADGHVAVPPIEILNTQLADLNEDGVVNMADFTLLANSYGFSEGDAEYDARADINDDRSVTIQDLALLGSHWKI